ncbi:MAG: hypothetical protein A2Z34_06175 [Planctomycetes bacterium RBG_16_59_8]|nr:MAG: hypothetical protein A2Z34_06175 [Planctomycetes bacterium RBG_16_59_8]
MVEPEKQAEPSEAKEEGIVDFRFLFHNSGEAQYLLDADDQLFLEVNPAFEKLTGYTRDEIVNGHVSPARLIAGESASVYQSKTVERKDRPSDRYELRILHKSGVKIPVEICVRMTQTDDGTILIGVVRDISRQKKLEEEMWDKIQNLGFASNRIYALTEKIRIVPELTNLLLPIGDEKELLEKAAQKLCDRQGLGYNEVGFYLVREDALELVCTGTSALSGAPPSQRKRRIPLDADNAYAKIYRNETPRVLTLKEAILPLKGREHNIGVVEVFFHAKEMDALKGNERALKGYQDLLETLANIIGLLVENLQLYLTVKRQSLIDQLTGVYNRRHLDAKLAEEIGRASRYNRDLAMFIIDIDRFKEINDTCGHRQGDAVLVETAQLLRRNTREVDIVGRYGGDEFVILMPETPPSGAVAKAESLRAAVADHPFPSVLAGGQPIKATLSIGVAVYSKTVKDADHFVHLADEALYRSKREGRNRVSTAAI